MPPRSKHQQNAGERQNQLNDQQQGWREPGVKVLHAHQKSVAIWPASIRRYGLRPPDSGGGRIQDFYLPAASLTPISSNSPPAI